MGKKLTAKKPSGLKITRNGDKLICEWTTHSYSSQTFQINVNNKKRKKTKKGKWKKGDLVWWDISVGANTNKKTIHTGHDTYKDGKKTKTIPTIKNDFRFRVKGTVKKDGKTATSDFKSARYKGEKMGIPTYIDPVLWNNRSNTYIYSWEQHSNDGARASSKKMFKEFYWETVVMPKNKEPNWKLAKQQKITLIDPTTEVPSTNQNSYGTSTATQPKIIIVEKTEDITGNSIRYFRIVTKARKGKLNSNYRNHTKVLGAPPQHNLDESSIGETILDENGTSVGLNIGSISPIESKMDGVTTEIQYAITPPYVIAQEKNNSMVSTVKLPVGFNSWSTDLNGKFVGSIPGNYIFRTTDSVVPDSALFLRIIKTHDERTSYGDPFLLSSNIYGLSSPTLRMVSADPVTKEVTVTVTNNSQLASGGNKSFIAVYCRSESMQNPEKAIGIIPYSSEEVTATFQAEWNDSEAASVSIGVRCIVGDYTPIRQLSSGVTYYTISNVKMESSGIIWEDNAVPLPPQNVRVVKVRPGVALVSWDWNWSQANKAEISWSEDDITWESTEEPSTYTLTNTRVGKRYITGLDATTYYVRVRFIRTVGETTSYGTYSDIQSVSMASAPNIPVLQLVPGDVAGPNDEITAYWQYESTDGTKQQYAELAEAFPDGDSWTYAEAENWIKVNSEKATFTPKRMGWEEGTLHYMCVRTTSASLKTSDGWSNPRPINVAEKPTISVSGIGGNSDPLTPLTITLDDGSSYTYPLALRRMPLTFTVNTSDSNGYVSVVIERSENFDIDRPDDSVYQGYKGETIFADEFEMDGALSTTIEILPDDLEGSLDDNADYTLLVSFTDSYGQTVSIEGGYDFTVVWERQAVKPTATIIVDQELDVAFITPIAPSGATENDRCEIYRLSADRPELIRGNAIFGETYVDPYPTFGTFGGYRIVHITEFGDYTTSNREFAWTDYNDDETGAQYLAPYNKFAVAIEFENNKVEFIGNVSLSHSWAKNFQTTVYLGGTVEGDWNADIIRTGTINSTIPVEYDPETTYLMRLLADYAGECHVRTPDGSNFYADVQAKDDREEKWVTRIAKVSLSYTAVDHDDDSALTYEEWLKEQ